MPYKNIADKLRNNEERRIGNKKYLVKMLGGKCIQCNESNIDLLEFDHIDLSTKEFGIQSRMGRALENLIEEVKKCQLLCFNCHIKKTASERVIEHGGGLAGKKNCPCDLCKAKKAEYDKNRKLEMKNNG